MIYKLAYCRKSTESDERQIQSIESQMSWLRGVLGSEFDKVTLFSESKSAKAPDQRKEFKNLIKEIDKINKKAKGEYEIHLYAWALDRLSRNPVDSGILQYYMQIGKLHKIVCSDKIYNPADSGIFMGMINAMSNQFILDLKKNVRRGMLDKVSKGGCIQKAPVGYKNNKNTNEVEVDEKFKPIVQKIFNLREEGYSLRELVKYCKKKGYKTPSGGDFSKTGIEKMLKNKFYIGFQTFEGKLYRSNHKTFITVSLFEKINKNTKTITRKNKDVFPLRGLIYDYETKKPLTATQKFKKIKSTGETREYIYYHTHGDSKNKISISQSKIIKHFDRIISDYEVTKITRKNIQGLVKRAFNDLTEEIESEKRSVTALLTQAENKSNKLMNMVCDDVITQDKFKVLDNENELLIEKYKEELHEINQKKIELKEKTLLFVELFENLSTKRKTWSDKKKLKFIPIMTVELFVNTKKDLYIKENDVFNYIKVLEGFIWQYEGDSFRTAKALSRYLLHHQREIEILYDKMNKLING